MKADNSSNGKKVGWICTYTPEELIHSAGFTPFRLLPDADSAINDVEDLLPASICPYARQILGSIRSGFQNDLEGIVIAQSCNAMLHLYNALKEDFKGFVYLLDLPRKQDRAATTFFAEELDDLLTFLENNNRPASAAALAGSIELYNRKINLIKYLLEAPQNTLENYFDCGLYGVAGEAATAHPSEFISKVEEIINGNGSMKVDKKTVKPSLLLSGGVPPDSLIKMLSSITGYRLYPEICTGQRYLLRPPIDNPGLMYADRKSMLLHIAQNYLGKPPCPRQLPYRARKNFYDCLVDDIKVKAVVYHDLMFCDLCHYDYLLIKDLLDQKEIPCLKIKTELGREDSGQLHTRIEAFLEIIQ